MNDKDITQLFSKMKADTSVCPDFDSGRSWKLVAERCGLDTTVKTKHYAVRDYIEFYVWQLTHAAVKPLFASVATVALLFAGLVGASNASFNTLPGDRLYPLKLSMEKAQLALAFDQEQRSQLELEFTSRRLDEMVELTAARNLANPIRVRIAVDQIKDNVASIASELQKTPTPELAKAVGRKTEAYRSAVRSTATNVPKEVAQQVAEVEELIDNTEDQAVEVIITTHENQEDESTAQELQLTFEKQLAAIDAGEDKELVAKLELAQALADEGSYRRAFQVLKEVELLLKQGTE